jgi:hypothetical protein
MGGLASNSLKCRHIGPAARAGDVRSAQASPEALISLTLLDLLEPVSALRDVTFCLTDPRFSGLYARRSNVDVGTTSFRD